MIFQYTKRKNCNNIADMKENLIESVKQIVLKASEIALKKDYDIMSKGAVTNIVTSADINVQKYLEKELCELLSGSGFLGEESNASEGVSSEYCWIVDPIDGTQNYARDLRQSGICVGLRHNKEVVLGVVYNPFINELYWAEKGKGSFLNGKQIHVSERPFQDAIFCTALSLYNKNYAKVCNQICMETYYKCNDVRRFGVCSLELCYLAAGKVELYYEYRLFPWDYAAASLILREAGGFIEDPFDKEVSLERPCPVIAANSKDNFNQLKEIVRKYMTHVPY